MSKTSVLQAAISDNIKAGVHKVFMTLIKIWEQFEQVKNFYRNTSNASYLIDYIWGKRKIEYI